MRGASRGRNRGDVVSKGPQESGGPIFVIQKHDASNLHYDFRLEVDGALKSWAVPKGPSTDPSEKRLAIPTPDHDVAHAEFEGVIAEGKEGAGPVLIWDRGRYENITEGDDGGVRCMAKALEEGHVLFRLYGKKLQGGFALHRTRSGNRASWLLIKMNDDQADARRNPVSAEPESVTSGRTLKQVADDEDADPEEDE